MIERPHYSNHLFLKLVFLISLAIAPSIAYTQVHALKLTKIKNGEIKRTKIYEEGERISLRTKDGEKYKGKFTVVDQTKIAVGDNEIPIEEIYKIRLSGDGKVILGTILLTAGWGAIALSTVYLFAEIFTLGIAEYAYTETLFLIGSASYGGGLYLLLSNSPKSKNWKIEIIKK